MDPPYKVTRLCNSNALVLSAVPTCTLTTGLMLTIAGVITWIWTPFELMMNERLRMRPGLPAFDWWKDIPETITINLYIFNVTNAEDFLAGHDDKLKLKEVGPIRFKEKWTHTDVVFNKNGTISYTINHTAIYMSELNEINLDATVTVPNLAVLGAASFLWDAPFYTKVPFNFAVRSLKSKPLVGISVFDFLYNFTDPIANLAHRLIPSVVPKKNFGVMHVLYGDGVFINRVTAYFGPKFGHERFSLIEKYDGSSDIPGRSDECRDKVLNASEGALYNQYITRNGTLRYYRKALCKVVTLYYRKDVSKYGIKGYKFVVPGDAYNRTNPTNNDCYKGSPTLMDGLTDASQCYFHYPLVASFPHFLHGDQNLRAYVDGLKPNPTLHDSYVYVEPLTGVPLESMARVQSNLMVRPLSGLHSMFHRFSNSCIPMFWIEYGMNGIPYYVVLLLYFTVNIVPIAQWVFTALMLILGPSLVVLSLSRWVKARMDETEGVYRAEQKTLLNK